MCNSNSEQIATAHRSLQSALCGVPLVTQWLMDLTRIQVQSLALLSRLRIQHCRELWCSLQMGLGSEVAVAVA